MTPEYHRNYLNQGDDRYRHNARCRVAYNRDIRAAKAATHKKRYVETLDETEARFRRQGSVCAACGGDTPGSKTGWHTDHNHRTRKVRGVLCCQCNAAIGYAKDSPERLRQLAVYLEKTDGIA